MTENGIMTKCTCSFWDRDLQKGSQDSITDCQVLQIDLTNPAWTKW